MSGVARRTPDSIIIPQEFDPAVPIDSLTEHPENPRDGDEKAIEASIDAHGFYGAIVAQKSTRYVIAGNHRHRDLRNRGQKVIPVFWLDVDDDEALRICLNDNASNDKAGYREDVLAALLTRMQQTPTGLAGSGYADADLTALIAKLSAGDEPVEPRELDMHRARKRTKRGDVWQLGEHRLMCGDCRLPADVDRLLDGFTVNLAFTSPPYADRRDYDEESGFEPIPPDEYVEWFAPVAANVADHLADDGSFFINIKPSVTPDMLDTELYTFDLVLAMVRRWGWHFATEFCWERTGVPRWVRRRFRNQFEPVYQFARGEWKFRPEAVMHWADTIPVVYGPQARDPERQGKAKRGARRRAGGRSGPVDRYQGDGTGKPGTHVREGMAYPGNRLPMFTSTSEATGHNAAFPVGLPAFFIKAYTDRGDTVFDPFAGSASTILAAQQEDRIGFGMEISARYVDMCCARWQRHTGITPILERTGRQVDMIVARAAT